MNVKYFEDTDTLYITFRSNPPIETLDLESFFKVAEADEGQGVAGAQKLSVQKLLDALSTGATKPFAASVEFEGRFLDENTLIDVDQQGNICSITIEHAQERVGETEVHYERVMRNKEVLAI